MLDTQEETKMNRKPASRKVLLLLPLLLVLFYNIAGTQTGSPWQWNLVLKQDRAGDAMITPTALYIDPEKGIYYVVDSGRNRLLSFDRKGELLNIFTAGKELETPFDMTRTDEDGIWVVEKGRNSLSYIDLKNKKVTPNTLHYQDMLIYPDRLESEGGTLYVLDKATGDILQYGPDLQPGLRFACDDCPWGFVDFRIHEKRIWALDQRRKNIYRFTLDGKMEDKTALGETVNFPVSLAIGPAGYIYVLDRHGRNICVYDKGGEFKYRFLEKGIARGQLYYPTEIRFDPWGGLCVLDEGNSRVEIFVR